MRESNHERQELPHHSRLQTPMPRWRHRGACAIILLGLFLGSAGRHLGAELRWATSWHSAIEAARLDGRWVLVVSFPPDPRDVSLLESWLGEQIEEVVQEFHFVRENARAPEPGEERPSYRLRFHLPDGTIIRQFAGAIRMSTLSAILGTACVYRRFHELSVEEEGPRKTLLWVLHKLQEEGTSFLEFARPALRRWGDAWPPWVELFVWHPDRTVREECLVAACRMRHASIGVGLEVSLYDTDPRIRAIAAGGFRYAELPAPDRLLHLLSDRDELVVRYTMASLGHLREERAIGPLLARVEQPGDPYRMDALRALAEIGGEDTAASLMPLLSGDASFRNLLIQALGEIGEPVALPALVAIVLDPRAPYEERHLATHAIGDIRDPSISLSLVPALSDPNRNIRAAVAETLGSVRGRDATSALLEAARSEPYEIARGYALDALGEMNAEESRDILLSALRRTNSFERAAAVRALCQIGDTSHLPLLREILHAPYSPAEETFLAKSLAVETLADFGDAGSIPLLIQALDTAELELARILFRALSRRTSVEFQPIAHIHENRDPLGLLEPLEEGVWALEPQAKAGQLLDVRQRWLDWWREEGAKWLREHAVQHQPARRQARIEAVVDPPTVPVGPERLSIWLSFVPDPRLEECTGKLFVRLSRNDEPWLESEWAMNGKEIPVLSHAGPWHATQDVPLVHRADGRVFIHLWSGMRIPPAKTRIAGVVEWAEGVARLSLVLDPIQF